MKFVTNTPTDSARNFALAAELEAEADEAKAAGREAWAAELYRRADTVHALAMLERRKEAEKFAANMDIRTILVD